jgi:hypothetical protein
MSLRKRIKRIEHTVVYKYAPAKRGRYHLSKIVWGLYLILFRWDKLDRKVRSRSSYLGSLRREAICQD